MNEDDFKKGLTDCVYFLASPLTCNKGIECVFRHSEVARLNPRDCWYWLGGCCYNPDCAFRHPPLEGLTEAYHESKIPSNVPTLPVEKTNIPCYFYSKGFCNKADRCSFLHDPADSNKAVVKNEVPCKINFSAGNNTGTTPIPIVVKNEVPCEINLSAGNNSGATHVPIVYTHPDTAQIKYTHTVMKHTPDSPQLASKTQSFESEENVEHEEFVHSEENDVQSEEIDVQSEEIVVENESDVETDQSSDDYVDQEKWLDLSPGFDVFVEGESERLEYEENDVDLFSVNDEHMELDYRYSECDRFDNITEQSRVSIFNRLSFKKTNTPRKVTFNVQRGSDLRDHLKKSKVVDYERRIQRNIRPHGSHVEVDFDHRGSLRKAVPLNRYRPPLKKPRFLSSDVSRLRKPAHQQKREFWKESEVFTGPKTLDQIKDEKKRARGNRDFGPNNRSASDGCFQGPKPLSEILKSKRKQG